MERDMIDDLERRLRAARPAAARADENAFDAELLARVRDQPIARRSAVPRVGAVPAAAGVTLTAAAAVMLGGGPGEVGGPSSVSAVTQALHWLNPPSGTILHARSVEAQGGRTTTREFWQSADHPNAERLRIEGGTPTVETSGDSVYDPATDTIYDAPGKVAAPGKPGSKTMPLGDSIVAKVRILLQKGHMAVTGREIHNGTQAWAMLAEGQRRPAGVDALGRRRGREAVGAARSRARRERAAAGHPLADLRGAARLSHEPADAQRRPPDGPRRARRGAGRGRQAASRALSLPSSS
jgi:hypothetical protein